MPLSTWLDSLQTPHPRCLPGSCRNLAISVEPSEGVIPAAAAGVPTAVSVSVGLLTGESAVGITGEVTIQTATAVGGCTAMPTDQTRVEVRKLALSGASVSLQWQILFSCTRNNEGVACACTGRVTPKVLGVGRGVLQYHGWSCVCDACCGMFCLSWGTEGLRCVSAMTQGRIIWLRGCRLRNPGCMHLHIARTIG